LFSTLSVPITGTSITAVLGSPGAGAVHSYIILFTEIAFSGVFLLLLLLRLYSQLYALSLEGLLCPIIENLLAQGMIQDATPPNRVEKIHLRLIVVAEPKLSLN